MRNAAWIMSSVTLLIMLIGVAPAFAECTSPCVGDLTGDGAVAMADLAELLAHYGIVCDQAWTADEYTVALWYLNGNGHDYSENGNDLTIKTDRVGWADDAPHCRGVLMGDDPWEGDCFNSDGGALTAPGAGCTYPGSGDWTVEAWVYFPSNNAAYTIVEHYSEHWAGHDPYMLLIDNGVAWFQIEDSEDNAAFVTADISAYKGQWVHLAGVYRYQQDVSLWIGNGSGEMQVLATVPTTLIPESLSNYNVYLGGHFCGVTTGLKLDEVRISDVARVCGPRQNVVIWPGNGHAYELIEVAGEGVTWYEAQDAARELCHLGEFGYLATATSSAETSFINSYLDGMGVSTLVIIGGFQDVDAPGYSEPAGGWRWITDEPWVYTNWHWTEPNDGSGDEDCLELKPPMYGRQWNDMPCSTHRNYYLVEYSTAD